MSMACLPLRPNNVALLPRQQGDVGFRRSFGHRDHVRQGEGGAVIRQSDERTAHLGRMLVVGAGLETVGPADTAVHHAQTVDVLVAEEGAVRTNGLQDLQPAFFLIAAMAG